MKKIAIVFPGQGSQALGMLNNLAREFPVIQDTFAEASKVFGDDLWKISQHGPSEIINQTRVTQPILLTASIALWRIWSQQKGTLPVVLAGHSLGEYSALVCAGALDFLDAVSLVTKRGDYMQEAVPVGKGAMAAIIGIEPSVITDICHSVAKEGIASPANFNSLGQVVIAGELAAVEHAMVKAKEAGAKMVKRLDVSVPSHCLLMRDAAKSLHDELIKITLQQPQIPVLHNVDVNAYENSAQVIKALTEQLYSPVRWVETIEAIARDYAVEAIVECGPGKVLSGLNKRITTIPTYNISEPEALEEALKNV